MRELDRRAFLGAAMMAGRGAPPASAVPIIDSHIHLFDQTRPQGAPYSGGPRNTAPALPARYRKLATPLGIVGAIEVEASPWIEDNLWVLQVEEAEPMMVGMIGNLQPDKPEFAEYLERFHRNRLFLGIRYGNLWGYNLVEQVSRPTFIEGLKLLREANLALDTANPRPELMDAVLRVTDRVPGLRIIIDHLPALLWRLDPKDEPAVDAAMRELAARPSVYVKVSAVMRTTDGKASTDPALYRPILDHVWGTFGEDRLIFGSDWPNADAVDNLPAIVQIVQEYFQAKGALAREKFFWRNSLSAYRWPQRHASQPQSSARG